MPDLSWLTRRPIAHRGLHDMNRKRWENTLSAFDAAARGNYAIECDVHLSSDGLPVVIHDADLKRLTGGKGCVCQMSAADLQEMPIGGTQDRIPTLEQALETIAGRVPVVIELKGVAGSDPGLVKQVATIVGRYKGHAALMSFEHRLVREFATDAPGIATGLTACGVADAELEQHFSMLAHGISFVSFAVAELPNRFVRFVRDRLAMPVITWTVSDEAGVETTRRYADQITFEGFAP